MEEQTPYEGFQRTKFVDNTEPRVACVLLLDTSGSMEGERINQVQEGLSVFHENLRTDRLASKRAEIAIVTFGGTVETLQPFSTADIFTPPTLRTSGQTPMGEAIRQGIELVTEEKQVYKANGISYFRPWIFLFTDGEPTDEWQSAARMVHEGEKNGSFSFFAIGTGDANMEILNAIADPSRPPVKVKGLNFQDMFIWLSSSIKTVSHSQPGERVKLPPLGWGEV